LKSANPDIHYEASPRGPATGKLGAAWPHIVALVKNPRTPKRCWLAAIGAVGSIRPAEAPEILLDIADSDDERHREAADEA